MISQYAKDLYYMSFGKLSICSLLWNKYFAPGRYSNSYLNIGSGNKYVEGMINIDGNVFSKKEIWLDVALGLPFKDNSIEGIYAHHFIEHFNSRTACRIFAEFYRVLKKGRALRLIVPSLEYAISAYSRGEQSAFGDFPEQYHSIGGRFNNFMLCANQHFIMLDASFLKELLSGAGFGGFVIEKAHVSRKFKAEYMKHELNVPSDPSLYLECIK